MDVNYLQDPAHVDLEDMEGEESAVKRLRRGMVDGVDSPGRPGAVAVRPPIDWEARVPLGDTERDFKFVGIEGAEMS